MTSPGDLRVVPARVTDAAAAARAIADTVRSADVAGPVRGSGTALPGSGYGAAAADLAGRWGSAVSALADAVAKHGMALSDSASAYQRSDERVVDDMQPAGGKPDPGAITRALG